MSTHYKKYLFRLSRIKNIDYPDPTIMNHLVDNQMHSIFIIKSQTDKNFKWKSYLVVGEQGREDPNT